MNFRRKRAAAASRFVPVLLLTAAIVLSSGCGGNNAANTGNGMKTQSYGNDGYLGTSNANPHLPGPHMAVSDANAADQMRRSISDLRGVVGANITFNGPDAFVTLKVDPAIDARKVPTVEREAATILRFNFPRYTIHVRSLR